MYHPSEVSAQASFIQRAYRPALYRNVSPLGPRVRVWPYALSRKHKPPGLNPRMPPLNDPLIFRVKFDAQVIDH